jgi:hypothetical protein
LVNVNEIIEIAPADEKVTSVKCKSGEECSFQFLLSNTSTQKVSLGVQVRAEEEEAREWITMEEGPIERKLRAESSDKATVEIRPPADLLEENTPPKDYHFHLLVYDARKPENTMNGDKVTVTIQAPKNTQGFFSKLFGSKKDKE